MVFGIIKCFASGYSSHLGKPYTCYHPHNQFISLYIYCWKLIVSECFILLKKMISFPFLLMEFLHLSLKSCLLSIFLLIYWLMVFLALFRNLHSIFSLDYSLMLYILLVYLQLARLHFCFLIFGINLTFFAKRQPFHLV